MLDGNLYFKAYHTSYGYELWKYNPLTGTTQVVNIRPGSSSSVPDDLTPYGSKLYFIANDGTHGAELMSYDGDSLRLELSLIHISEPT